MKTVNNLRLRLEHTIDWCFSEGPQLGFAYDQYPYSDFGGWGAPYINGQTAVNTTGTVASLINTNDPVEFNQGDGYYNYTQTVTGGQTGSGSVSIGLLATPATAITFTNYELYPQLPTVTIAGVPTQLAFATGGAPTQAGTTFTVNAAGTGTGGGTTGVYLIGGRSNLGDWVMPINVSAQATTGASFNVVGYNWQVLNNGIAGTPTSLGSVMAEAKLVATGKSIFITFAWSTTLPAGGGSSFLHTNYYQPITPNGAAATVSNFNLYPQRNPYFNQGFFDRIRFLKAAQSGPFQNSFASPSASSASLGSYFQWQIIIPLKHLHDYFAQTNMPIINVGYNMMFTLAQPNGNQGVGSTTYPPMMTSANLASTTDLVPASTTSSTQGIDTTSPPVIFYGVAPNNSSANMGSAGCRLYYRTVKFSPADNERMAALLNQGFKRNIKFLVTDWIIPPNAVRTIPATVGALLQQQITQSSVHPVRVWCMLYETGALSSYQYSIGMCTGKLLNANILINNVPYFRNFLLNSNDMWEQLKEQVQIIYTSHTSPTPSSSARMLRSIASRTRSCSASLSSSSRLRISRIASSIIHLRSLIAA